MSSVIIYATAFGILIYAGMIVLSVWRPDSPFQTPGSQQIAAICKKILPVRSTVTPSIVGKLSAIRWILEISTTLEAIEAAAAMILLVQWSRNIDASAAYAHLRDHFVACRDEEELYVKYGKGMAYLCSQSTTINPELLQKFDWDCWGGRSRFIRDAFMAGRDAYHRFQNPQQIEAPRKHRADARTALRTMVVHGLDTRLSLPDDEQLIWNGDIRWRHRDGNEPDCEEFDWLIDYLADEAENDLDDETEGDAILALSAMEGLGSPAKRSSYISSLIRCMAPTRPSRVRYAALRAVFDARGELVPMPQDVDGELLDELSYALLTAVWPDHEQTIQGSSPDTTFHEDRDLCYLRLISLLTKHDEWCQRLIRDGHVERCISLVDQVYSRQVNSAGCYLLVIFGHMDPSGKHILFNPAEHWWRERFQETWQDAHSYMSRYVDGIEALVTTTRLNCLGSDHGVWRGWLADLAQEVHETLVTLQRSQATLVNEFGVAQATVDTATSSVQGLYAELSHMIEYQNT
ncbi:uncharacterized protein EDB91DRAFT_1177968 [Suillus paluster]|uniref:uncharacterized protein n=1 Tax=Suillus paluster TaxID=48578 RepID=UPI001B88302D|nr:uncharacterized protein EDB91DRAFT_1177968 [Suillus paluster]KAG1720499.1 hypothetical protein EDB91DRAFT_1177968 [Suillus paluster]